MNLPQSLRPEVPELSVNTAEVNFLSKTQKKQTPLWRQDTRTQGLNGTTTRTTIDSTGGTGVLTAIRSTQHAARSRRTHHTSELTNMIGVVANLSYLHTHAGLPVSRDTLFGRGYHKYHTGGVHFPSSFLKRSDGLVRVMAHSSSLR